MPKIPTFQANPVIRSTGMDPRKASAGYRALAKAGQALMGWKPQTKSA